jgi:hypothetical protein
MIIFIQTVAMVKFSIFFCFAVVSSAASAQANDLLMKEKKLEFFPFADTNYTQRKSVKKLPKYNLLRAIPESKPESEVSNMPVIGFVPDAKPGGRNENGFDLYVSPVDSMTIVTPNKTFESNMPVHEPAIVLKKPVQR